MSRLSVLVLALSTAAGCIATGPAGGHLTMDLSGDANVVVTEFEASQFAAFYNSGMAPPEGWSTVTATTTSLQAMSHDCKAVALGFSGRPDLGRTLTLDLSVEDDNAGTNLTDRGKLVWQQGCATDGDMDQWRSTGGTLEITSVDEIDPSYVQAGTDPNGVKTVGFTFSDVAMAPDPQAPGAASGTFVADGEGSVDLFTGLLPQ